MVRHLKDGEDFGPSHFQESGFGFTGSSGLDVPRTRSGRTDNKSEVGREENPAPARYAQGGMVDQGAPEYAGGGHVERCADGGHMVHHGDGTKTHHHPDGTRTHHHADGTMTHHHADGRTVHHHQDGTMSVHHGDGRVVHHHADGSHTVVHHNGTMIHHHAHGGHTVHHADGGVEHHHPDGSVEHHDSSEFAHGGAIHGDLAQDKAMIGKAFREHDAQEHPGQHTHLDLARGGIAAQNARIPRGMRPMAMRRHSPIEEPPAAPKNTPSIPNQMPGGVAAYGVQPSSEPDQAGADQSIPQMRGGGRVRR